MGVGHRERLQTCRSRLSEKRQEAEVAAGGGSCGAGEQARISGSREAAGVGVRDPHEGSEHPLPTLGPTSESSVVASV